MTTEVGGEPGQRTQPDVAVGRVFVERVGGEAPSVVVDDESQRAVVDVERHPNLGGRGVGHDVAQCLLGGPVDSADASGSTAVVVEVGVEAVAIPRAVSTLSRSPTADSSPSSWRFGG